MFGILWERLGIRIVMHQLIKSVRVFFFFAIFFFTLGGWKMTETLYGVGGLQSSPRMQG